MPQIIFVGGTAGCGKSTVGDTISKILSKTTTKTTFIEGDEYHPQENLDKMSKGHALNDDDRWGWLINLSKLSIEKTMEYDVVVVSCSMLKLKYRELIRTTIHQHFKELVATGSGIKEADVFMFILFNEFKVIYDRMTKREGHFMKAHMLESQFTDLELPTVEEKHCYKVVCNDDSPDVIVSNIIKLIKSQHTK